MTESLPPNPNSLQLAVPSPPPPALPPPPPPSAPLPSQNPRLGFSFPRPPIRVTSEFDSESAIFFHKISCKFFDSLAKLKLSFQNNNTGKISYPQVGFITKYLSIHYDPEDQNAYVKGSFDVRNRLHFRAAQDIKSSWFEEPNCFHIRYSTECFCVSCASDGSNSVITYTRLGYLSRFKYCHRKEQQGEVAVVASLADPSYKLELSSAVPSIGLPKATFRFPLGEVSLERIEEEEADNSLAINGIIKGQLLNGVCIAQYKDKDLNLRYSYKDEEMSFIPSISLPSNALSLAFKRQFSPSDKLSYWYNFDSDYWSTVYKHKIGKDLKFKAGYDSEVRLGWASLWVGNEAGKTKTAPVKMKVQFMLQVPQDDIKSPVFMFRVKKRWDF